MRRLGRGEARGKSSVTDDIPLIGRRHAGQRRAAKLLQVFGAPVLGMLTRFATLQPANSSRRCALVVDDEPLVRRLVCRALARTGFDVFEAVNGQAALALIRAGDFDVVVSDVDMPVMGGLELLQCLRVERPELPVVLLSGHFRLTAGQRPTDLGACALLGKPFSIEDVQRTALRVVQARARADAAMAQRAGS